MISKVTQIFENLILELPLNNKKSSYSDVEIMLLILGEMIDESEVQSDLMNKVVDLSSIEAISSTSIRVSWTLLSDSTFVEGFHVR